MTRIFIYMEGGGDAKEGRASLRQGMDAFLRDLKQKARARAWEWRLVCCGGRGEARRCFRKAWQKMGASDVCMLLVDAEDAVKDASPRAHLRRRDGWNLDFADDRRLHLMVRTMEAWIVADPDALADWYGQGFRRAALPKSADLESVPKHDIESALERATRPTRKGAYHKIHHATHVLAKIDSARVRARCRYCDRLFSILDELFH